MKQRSFKSDPARGHRTPQEKARILREHGRSGLSLLAFAREHGLCYASLLRWRSRPPTRPTPAGVVVRRDAQGGPRFVPVTIEGEVLAGDYIVSWPGGRCLKVPPHFETESLRRLLRVLEEPR